MHDAESAYGMDTESPCCVRTTTGLSAKAAKGQDHISTGLRPAVGEVWLTFKPREPIDMRLYRKTQALAQISDGGDNNTRANRQRCSTHNTYER